MHLKEMGVSKIIELNRIRLGIIGIKLPGFISHGISYSVNL